MKKVILILTLAILPIWISSCSRDQAEEAANVEETATTTTEVETETPEVFEETAPPIPSGQIDVAGLIPATNPSEVQVETGRSDPFATVPVQPIITVEPTVGNGETAQPGTPTNGTTQAQPGTPTNGTTQAQPSTPINDNGITQVQPGITANGDQTVTVEPPPPPTPSEAQGVLVSGVLQMPTHPVAIIKAPGERVARQVTRGEVISNGQVLVKAIYATDDPVVVLEQYGIEVFRGVGEAPIGLPNEAETLPEVTSELPQG